MSDPCSSIDWSVSAAASAYSQLSGVFAAFVFSAIVLLLGRKGRDVTSMGTLSLFLSAFLVLSFASFCYGTVTGESVTITCGRAYTMSAIAGGLLGLGVVMMVSGIAWLGSGYLQSETISKSENWSEMTRCMSLLSNLTVYGMSSLVAAMLGVTIADYVKLASVPVGLRWTILVSPFAIVSTAIAISYYTSRRKTRGEFDVRITSGLIFRFSVLAPIVLALTATIYSGVISEIPVQQWQPVPTWAIITTSVLSLVFPLLILVALVLVVPKPLNSGALADADTNSPDESLPSIDARFS